MEKHEPGLPDGRGDPGDADLDDLLLVAVGQKTRLEKKHNPVKIVQRHK